MVHWARSGHDFAYVCPKVKRSKKFLHQSDVQVASDVSIDSCDATMDEYGVFGGWKWVFQGDKGGQSVQKLTPN